MNYQEYKPHKDLASVVKFYWTLEVPAQVDTQKQLILPDGCVDIEKMEIPDMQMGIFPYEGEMAPGIILKAEGSKPSADGVTIYLNGGDNLQVVLDKVEKNGGKILMPKTAHADGNGYFALFLDTEGNKIGLSSPN
jgi:uncharacterized protein